MNAASSATAASAASVRFILDKPLHELTEDDISQLTREDCRRYLKEKGMRRPSWNKSQAIQQVISLKALLEPPAPSPAASAADPPRFTSAALQPAPMKASAVAPLEIPSPHLTSNSSSSLKELSPIDGETPASVSADEGVPDLPVGPSGLRGVDSDCRADSLRDADVSNLPVGQMTIFYRGKVNIYDGVPADKAEAIMQLAASPHKAPQVEPFDGNSAQWGTSSHLSGSSVKVNVIPGSRAITQPAQTGKTREYVQQHRQEWNVPNEADVDGQTSRQVSLQRYLEKRKDRGRFKVRKKVGASSSGLEVYLNDQMRIQVAGGQSSPSRISSPTQPGLTRAHCGFIDNQSKTAGCAVNLNDKVHGVSTTKEFSSNEW